MTNGELSRLLFAGDSQPGRDTGRILLGLRCLPQPLEHLILTPSVAALQLHGRLTACGHPGARWPTRSGRLP